MQMEKTQNSLTLIKDKISDFKIELTRVKEKFSSSVKALVDSELQTAKSKNDQIFINIYSSPTKALESMIKGFDFLQTLDQINSKINELGLDSNLLTHIYTTDDIEEAINNFVTEYGIVKFFNNSIDSILLDLDQLIKSKATTPDASVIISPEEAAETELDEEDEEEGEDSDLESELTPEAKKLSKKELLSIEASFNKDDLPTSDLLGPSDLKFSEEYIIDKFLIRRVLPSNLGKISTPYYAALTSDNKWICTKSGKPIYSRSELDLDSKLDRYAFQALNIKPDGFIKWKDGLGGRKSRVLKINVKPVGDTEVDPKAVIAVNLRTSTSFFFKKEPSLIRRFDFIKEKLQKELKSKYNDFLSLYSIYPEFSNLEQNNLFFIDETVVPNRLMVNEKAVSLLNDFVIKKLQLIKSEIQGGYNRSFSKVSNSVNYDITYAENARYENSSHLDNLLNACKIRDKLVYSEFISLKNLLAGGNPQVDASSFNAINLDKVLISNALGSTAAAPGKLLFDVTKLIFFSSSMYVESFAYKMSFILKGGSEAIYSNPDNTSATFNQFSDALNRQLSSKYYQFFNLSNTAYLQQSYSTYISSSIKLNFLYMNSYNEINNSVRIGWNYISCPTCNKDIYFSKYLEGKRGNKKELLPLLSSQLSISEQKLKAYIDPAEMSDYDEERYSFFKQDGSIITTEELMKATNGGWSTILAKISSSNSLEHKEGVNERQNLLASLGAKKIKTKKVGSSVFFYKTKCPFSDEALLADVEFGEVTSGPQSLMDIQKELRSTGKNIFIKDFSCGLSLNTDELIRSTTRIEPYEIHSAPSPVGINPVTQLNQAVDDAISKGLLSEGDRVRFLDELKRRKSGGWKFSSLTLNCPCKIDAPSPSEPVEKYSDTLRLSSYLASPVSGFIKREYIENGMVHPPVDSFGNPAILEDGTAVYPICGKNVSISSFCRDSADPGSIYSILKSKFIEAKSMESSKAAIFVTSFVDTLLQFGVDFNDILPFIDRAYSEVIKTNISLAHKSKLQDIIKIAAQSVINLDLESHEYGSNLSRMQVLGDLKLICSSGHRFRVLDSIRFGQTHTTHTVPKSQSALITDFRSLLSTTGFRNLNAACSTTIPLNRFGNTIISRINKQNIPPQMKDFREWDGRWDLKKGLSEYYYTDDNGNYYIFNSRSTSVAWGSYDKAESSGLVETRDPSTRMLLKVVSKEVSEIQDASEESESSAKINLIDKIAAENYHAEMNEKENSMDIENLRAKLEVIYAPMAVNIQSVLMMMKDLCNMSTSIGVNADLYGSPASLDSNDIKSISEESESIMRKLYINVAEQGTAKEKKHAATHMESVISEASRLFNDRYLNLISGQDIKFLFYLASSVSLLSRQRIAKEIATAITAAVGIYPYSGEPEEARYEEYKLKEQSRRKFDPEFISDIENDLFGNELMGKIDAIIDFVKSKVSVPKGTEIQGFLSEGPVVNLSISKMQSKEFMGRALSLSAAISLADSLSVLYNKYLKDGSLNYIGIDLGVDFSTPDKIITFNKNNGSLFRFKDLDIQSIPTAFPLDQFEGVEGVQDITIDDYNDLDPDDKDDFDSWAKEFIADNELSIRDFTEALKNEVLKVEVSCTNSEYMRKAVDLMRTSLLFKIDQNKISDPNEKRIARTLVDKCIVVPPVTTLSFVPGDKYHNYYSGSQGGKAPPGGPFRMLPLFGAEVISLPQLKDYSYPVFLLTGTKINGSANLGVSFSGTAPPKKDIILYKDIDETGITPYNLTLPQEVVSAGWKTGLISGKFVKSYNKDISLFYHPFTLAISNDGTLKKPSFDYSDIIGFKNSFLNFDSTRSFSFGPRFAKTASLLQYPPTYSGGDCSSNVGFLLPIKYGMRSSDRDITKSNISTFFDARLPVEIPGESPGSSIKIDMSDFLMRDPPELAEKILLDISRHYIDYEVELSRLSKTRNSQKEIELKDKYKKIFLLLFNQYRNLPYKVAATTASTYIKDHGIAEGISAEAGYSHFIPMADYVTCYKILNSTEFSPEFNGHTLWSDGDNSNRAAVKGALEKMLIDSNNLDELAAAMSQELTHVTIDARDLLDPFNKLFNKFYQEAKAIIRIKSKGFSVSSESESSISELAAKLIKEITCYPHIGEQYTPGASSYRHHLFWNGESSPTAQTNMRKKYPSWVASTGNFFPVIPNVPDFNGEPSARIKVMNEIFPFNGGTSVRSTRLADIQDPTSNQIIEFDDFYMHPYIHGERHVSVPYIGTATPEQIKKNLDDLKADAKKAGFTIGAVKYAKAIANSFIDQIVVSLRERIILESARKDVEADIVRIKELGGMKPISKKAALQKSKNTRIRVAPIETVDNLRRAGMLSLLDTFNK